MKSIALTSIAFTFLLKVLPSLAQSCSPISNVQLTFYGWPDNSPPGPANAFDCGRGKSSDGQAIAGGTGTYDDPISFATATDNKNFAQCAIVYVPSLRKYFRNEDDCAQCTSDWDGSQKFHIDLWTGSNTQTGGTAQTDCENTLPGGSQEIINNAPNGLPVDSTPLYDQASQKCYQKTYPVGDASGLCAGGGGGGGNAAASPPTASSSSPASSSAISTSFGPTTLQTSAVAKSTSNPSSSCSWPGHCIGAPCQTYNDCDGTDVCGPANTCVALS